MNLICLIGNKGVGKDTVGDYLRSSHKYTPVQLAGRMKQVANILFDWDRRSLEDRDFKEEVDHKFGLSPRQFLQWFGTEAMQEQLSAQFPSLGAKFGRLFWCHRLWNDIKNLDRVVITDMRFLHEQLFFQDKPGVEFWSIQRDVGDVGTHRSETEVSRLYSHRQIDNNGSKEDLFAQVDEAMGEIHGKISH